MTNEGVQIVESWISALGSEREASLDAIGRYSMYNFRHRTSIALHARRVAWMYLEVWPILMKQGLVFSKGYVQARIHDDPEVDPNLLDVQAGHKAVMDAEALAELERKELLAIDYVVERFGQKVGPYGYRSTLVEAKERRTKEAQAIKSLDKYDAWNEAVLELRWGNRDVIIRKANEFGDPAPVPFEHYPKLVAKLANESELLAPLFQAAIHPFIAPLPVLDFHQMVEEGRPHTAESIRQPTGIPAHDVWIEMIFKYSPAEPTWLWEPNTRHYANCP